MSQLTGRRPAGVVAIDGRAISHPQPGGFKTYSTNLVKHLAAVDDSLEFEIIVDRPVATLGISARPNLSVTVVRASLPGIGVPFRENVALPYHLLRDRAELIHFPNASAALWVPCPFVMTVHDAMELMPISTHYGGRSLKRNLMHHYNRLNQKLAAHRARAIITVSKSSKRDIAQWLNIPEQRIFVTYEAPDQSFTPTGDPARLSAVRHQYGLAQDYILGIGSADPRKNIAGLLRAYSHLPAELVARHQLAIVLTHSRFQPALEALAATLGIATRVCCLTAVSNADLASLYSGAALFAFPSLYEGFGLPPLEAMTCGAPVIAANNSCLGEILGDAAIMVDDVNPAGDLAELTQALSQVLSNPRLRAALSQAGAVHARSFSWERCARETVSVYRLALSRVSLAGSLNHGRAFSLGVTR